MHAALHAVISAQNAFVQGSTCGVLAPDVQTTPQKGQHQMKKIILVALTALVLGLASIGGAAPTLAGSDATGGHGGNTDMLAGGRGGMSGDLGGGVASPVIAGGRGGMTGDVHACIGEPAIAGSKAGASIGVDI